MTPFTPGQNLYQTQADERFNSFADPSAIAYNQMRGNWGINPNLLTPAYASPYRPQFNGYQGNPYGAPSPGFFNSANQVFNPFSGGGRNYGGNYYQQQSPYYDSLGYNPLDHGMNFAQKWAVPGFTSWLSYKFLARPLGNMAHRLGAGVVTGLAGGSFSAGTTAMMANVGGSLAGFAGSTLAPALAAKAVVWAADKTIFDPYIAQRQMIGSLRRNFAGVTFGDGTGNRVTGGGMSRTQASDIAGEVSRFTASDRNFSQAEGANVTDLAARAGLLDNVQGGQIGSRIKSTMVQMKTIMQLANSSDFREVIQMMAKLQTQGVNQNDFSRVATQLKNFSSVAGISLQKMMDTVGAQGSYLYGANGITPYVGALQAANAYAGFSAAQRSGLLSNALLARMGGVEGAAQSANAGLLSIAETPYMKIHNYEKYVYGGTGRGGTPGLMSKFGGQIALDPTNAAGNFNLLQGAVASKALEKEGLTGQLGSYMDMMRQNMPQEFKSGHVKAGALYEYLTQNGVPPDQAKAMIFQKLSMQDPESYRTTIAGITREGNESRLKSAQNLDITYGTVGNMLYRPIKTAGMRAEQYTAEGVSRVGRAVSSLTDTLEEGMTKFQLSDINNPLADAKSSLTLGDVKGGRGSGLMAALNRLNDWAGHSVSVVAALDKLKNDQTLLGYLASGNTQKIKGYLKLLVNNGVLESAFNDPKLFNELYKALIARGTKLIKGHKGKSIAKLMGTKDDATGRELANLFIEASDKGNVVSQDMLDRFSKLTGKEADITPFEAMMHSTGIAMAFSSGEAKSVENTPAANAQLWQQGGKNLQEVDAKNKALSGMTNSVVDGGDIMSALQTLGGNIRELNVTGGDVVVKGNVKFSMFGGSDSGKATPTPGPQQNVRNLDSE